MHSVNLQFSYSNSANVQNNTKCVYAQYSPPVEQTVQTVDFYAKYLFLILKRVIKQHSQLVEEEEKQIPPFCLVTIRTVVVYPGPAGPQALSQYFYTPNPP